MNFKLKDIGPQLLTVIAVVLVFGFFTYNAQVNMENRGIDFGYGFDSPYDGVLDSHGWETHFVLGQNF